MKINIDQINNLSDKLYNKDSKNDDNSFSAILGISSPFTVVIQNICSKADSISNNIEYNIKTIDDKKLKNSNSVEEIKKNGEDSKKDKIDRKNEKSIEDQINITIESITILKNYINILKGVKKAITALIVVYSLTEMSISLAPPLTITIPLIRKYDDIKELKKLLKAQLLLIEAMISKYEEKYNSHENKIEEAKIESEIRKNKIEGINNTPEQIKINIIDNLADSNITEEYYDFILKVEKYGKKQLIGKAIDKISGMILVQTAPSFILKPDNLIQELKNIIEN